MKFLLPLTLIALLGASSIVVAQDLPEQNQQQLKAAQELADTGHKAEALVELHKMLDANGFDPVGFYNLGNAFARLDESEAAIRAYRRAIEQRAGGYARAQNNLGVVLLREGRWDEAYEAFNAALRIENFHYAEASYNLGRLYAARGEHDLAVREWRRALLVNPKHAAAAQALARGVDDDVIAVEKAPPAPRSPRSLTKPTTTSSEVPMVARAGASGRPGKLTIDQTGYDFLQRARSASERGKMVEAVDNF